MYHRGMNPDEFYNFENRAYTSPTVSRDETLAFADTLRDVQAKNNAQIASQTQNLGTDVSSIQGGLGGSEGYFRQRYQTIPSEVARNNLRATAQAKALNDLMTNAENQWKNRYNQAYRSAKARSSSSGGNGADGGYNQGQGSGTAEFSITSYPGTRAVGDINNNYKLYYDLETGKLTHVLNSENQPISDNDPYYGKLGDEYVSKSSQKWLDYAQRQQEAAFLDQVLDIGEAMFSPGYFIGKQIGGLFSGL